MANSNSSGKAQRAQILVAGIEMRVYLLPDLSYKLAGRNVTDAIDEDNNSLIRLFKVKSLKALPHADKSLIQIKAETGESIIPVHIDDAIVYWDEMGDKGNRKAKGLVRALALESLERRADAAFNILRTEQEREQRAALRVKRIIAYRSWTDQVKLRQEQQGYYRDSEGKITARATAEYRDLTVKVNLSLFGQPHFNCDRDTMSLEQQVIIESFETFLARWAVKYPNKSATQLVGECLNIFSLQEAA